MNNILFKKILQLIKNLGLIIYLFLSFFIGILKFAYGLKHYF